MRFSHMYTIAFHVTTDSEATDVKENEILAALAGRLQDMIANKGEIFEAVGEPDESIVISREDERAMGRPQNQDSQKHRRDRDADETTGDSVDCEPDTEPIDPEILDAQNNHGQGDVLTFQSDGAPVIYTEEQRDRDKGRDWNKDAEYPSGVPWRR